MKCSCCGKEIGEIAFDKSYKMPDEIWELSESEREERTQIGSDLCRLDERYFIRGVAYFPVIDTDKSYGWGIWAEVHQDNFFEYVKSYNEDNSSKPAFSGKAANQIPSYENTLGLELNVKLGNETQRPTLFFTRKDHSLTKEQSEGIAIEKVHGFGE
ncbi:MAG: DUF2199 domain-containing protein [Marinagarivorans sp.]